MDPIVRDVEYIPKLYKHFAIYKLFFLISRSLIWPSIPLQLYISVNQNVNLILVLASNFMHIVREMCVYIYIYVLCTYLYHILLHQLPLKTFVMDVL